MPQAWKLRGALDENRLEESLRELIRRHESLRTSFTFRGGELVQVIHREPEWELERYPVTEEERLPERIASFVRPFDLGKAPLFRAALILLETEGHLMVMDLHHIISDGVSMEVLMRDWSALYRGEELEAPRIQYKDYAVWQQSESRRKAMEKQEGYWMQRFADGVPVLELPTDFPRPAVAQFKGAVTEFRADEALTAEAKRLALETDTTLYTVLLAAYHVLLSKYSGQDDIVIGTAVAGRPHADLEQVVGMFVNTLALRHQSRPEESFRDFLARVRKQVVQAQEHGDYPFEELVERLELPRDLGRHPLVDTLFVMQNMDHGGFQLPGIDVEPYKAEWHHAKYDLMVAGVEGEELSFYCGVSDGPLPDRDHLPDDSPFLAFIGANHFRSGPEDR